MNKEEMIKVSLCRCITLGRLSSSSVTYDMVYERAQDNINAIGDYKADLIMGK